MYKPTLIKLINQLKTNILKDLNKHEQSKLYINSWVLGGLDMILAKANGETASIYPHNASYKYLFNEFLNCFFCLDINEKIKDETYKYLNTTNNIILVDKISNLINK